MANPYERLLLTQVSRAARKYLCFSGYWLTLKEILFKTSTSTVFSQDLMLSEFRLVFKHVLLVWVFSGFFGVTVMNWGLVHGVPWD